MVFLNFTDLYDSEGWIECEVGWSSVVFRENMRWVVAKCGTKVLERSNERWGHDGLGLHLSASAYCGSEHHGSI